MTQVARYGHMMKVAVTQARLHVKSSFTVGGSVLAQTIRAGCTEMNVHLEVESPEDPPRVAALLRNAENGCFAMQMLLNPVPVQSSFALNGKSLNLASYPPPGAK